MTSRNHLTLCLRYRPPLAFVLFVLVMVLSPPSSAQEGQSSAAKTRRGEKANATETLTRELVEARRRAIIGEVEVERLRQRVLELEAELQARTRGSASEDDPLSRLDPYDPLRHGSEPLDTGDSTPGPAEPGKRTIEVEEIDDPLEEPPPPATGPHPGSTSTGPAQGRAIRPGVNDQPPNAEALELYDRGYALFHQESYRQAEELFAQYIGRYPETELADNALFWIGECRWALEDYAGALDAFTETVTRFPGGNKVPDAMLKAGKCLEALDRPEQARATYHELVERFPGTLASISAEERLRGLQGGP